MSDVEPDEGEEFDDGPVDVDLNVLADEAEGKPFRVRFGEHVYELPYSIDFRVVYHAQRDELPPALELMFGDELDQFLAEPVPFNQQVLGTLLARWAEHSGMTLPKSSASPPSSNRKARRSRPTSAGTTKPTSRTSRRAG